MLVTPRKQLRQAAQLTRAAVKHGPDSTRVAIDAKRRGAKQKLLEFAALVALVKKQPPTTVVEIGTLKGGTLWAWCRLAVDDAVIVSIDLPGGPFGGGYEEEATDRLRSYAQSSQAVHLIRGDSHDPATLERVTQILGGRGIELLFIDADHTYNGVRRDFELFSPLVRPGGLIAFHDVVLHDDRSCEVDRLWREVAPRYDHLEFVDHGVVRHPWSQHVVTC